MSRDNLSISSKKNYGPFNLLIPSTDRDVVDFTCHWVPVQESLGKFESSKIFKKIIIYWCVWKSSITKCSLLSVKYL